jgi:hypothetical protein
MIYPDEFNQLFTNIIKPKKPVDINYRLYYNKETGKPLQYTIDEQDGDYIVITKQQYAESRYDSVVINGKLTTVNNAVRWSKLVPSNEGVACAVDNVMIVDRDSSTKWKIKTHDAE